MSEKKGSIAWLLLFLLSLIWGSSFILIKRGLEVFSPGQVGAIRILSAALFLMPIALARLKSIKRSNVLVLLSVGLAGSFVPAFLFAKAQTHLESSVTGILNALTPLFTMMLGVIAFRQKTKIMVVAGLLLGFLGTAFLIIAGAVGSNGLGLNYYAFYVVLATVLYGVNLNLIKYRLEGMKALTITSLSLLFVGPLAITYLFGASDFVSTLQHHKGAYVSLFYLCILGVMGTAVALILFNRLVKITSPIFASSVTYVIPVIAVAWGIWDGEMLSKGHYIGMGFILAGVYLANRK